MLRSRRVLRTMPAPLLLVSSVEPILHLHLPLLGWDVLPMEHGNLASPRSSGSKHPSRQSVPHLSGPLASLKSVNPTMLASALPPAERIACTRVPPAANKATLLKNAGLDSRENPTQAKARMEKARTAIARRRRSRSGIDRPIHRPTKITRLLQHRIRLLHRAMLAQAQWQHQAAWMRYPLHFYVAGSLEHDYFRVADPHCGFARIRG